MLILKPFVSTPKTNVKNTLTSKFNLICACFQYQLSVYGKLEGIVVMSTDPVFVSPSTNHNCFPDWVPVVLVYLPKDLLSSRDEELSLFRKNVRLQVVALCVRPLSYIAALVC